MTTDVIPVLHVADADVAATWYRRLGFEVNFEHRFEPGFPLYVGIRREGAQIHLSEHTGDARPDTLVYVWVDDIDSIAAEFGVGVEEQPWARDVELTDPDGNRLRVGQPMAPPDVDMMYGEGTAAALDALETAMWQSDTRFDATWMERHLTTEFVEHGMSGRIYDRRATIDAEPTDIDIDLPLGDVVVRPLGRDAVLITYRSVQPRGAANRASVWVRADGRWLLAFHQGTPVGT